jgi:hypothetical protein
MLTLQRTDNQDLTHSELAADPSERPGAIRQVSSVSFAVNDFLGCSQVCIPQLKYD